MPRKRSQQPLILIALGAVLIAGAMIIWGIKPSEDQIPVSTLSSAELPYPDVPRVSVGDAKAAFELQNAVFVDVRGEPYYSEGHIPGALSISTAELENRVDELDQDDWIILYCT